MTYRPLADEIRPQTLDEVVGQRHILGKDGLLRRIIDSGSIPNLVFYGPSGTGKTTVANIIARRTNRPLHRLNATTASISDIITGVFLFCILGSEFFINYRIILRGGKEAGDK